jgi:type IV pilus assembly protein PilC
MAKFIYRARTAAGQMTRGTLRATSEAAATTLLRSHNLVPVEITQAEEVAWWNKQFFSSHLSQRDLILFTRQLGSMIRAGVPVLQALQTLQKQDIRPTLRKLLQDITYDVESGNSLSAAMGKYDQYFSLFILGMIRTGEASGKLSQSLLLIADYIERDYSFMRKVRVALTYPIFVVVVVTLLSIVMVTFVLPQLVVLFKDAGVTLPLPTRILIGITSFFQSYWVILAVLAVAAGFLIRSYVKTPEGRYAVSTWILVLPIVNRLFRKLYLARLASILHTLFTSDVPALESLRLAREAMGNKVYQRILDSTVEAIKDGASISFVWEQEPFIPPMLTTMVRIGEKSGNVAASFAEASAFFQRDVEDVLESVSVLLEPILIVALGIGVGIVVGAVLLPIYNLVLVI